MAETQTPTIRCKSCDAKYRWSEKLAGKRVKCKCGEVLTFPKSPTSDAAGGKSPGKSSSGSKSSSGGKPKKLKSQHDDSMFDSEGAYRLNLEDADKGEKPTVNCPNCNAELNEGAILCTECGINPRTGQLVPGVGVKKKEKSGPGMGTLIKIAFILALLGATAWAVNNFWLQAS